MAASPILAIFKFQVTALWHKHYLEEGGKGGGAYASQIFFLHRNSFFGY